MDRAVIQQVADSRHEVLYALERRIVLVRGEARRRLVALLYDRVRFDFRYSRQRKKNGNIVPADGIHVDLSVAVDGEKPFHAVCDVDLLLLRVFRVEDAAGQDRFGKPLDEEQFPDRVERGVLGGIRLI